MNLKRARELCEAEIGSPAEYVKKAAAVMAVLPEALELLDEARELLEHSKRLGMFMWNPDSYAEQRDAWLKKVEE